MHLRTANISDVGKIVELYKEVAASGDFYLTDDDITTNFVTSFVESCERSGLLIVAVHPDDDEKLIGSIHAHALPFRSKHHVYGHFSLLVSPAFQRKKIGRTLFTVFLEEIGRNRPHVGKVELAVPESNVKALTLFQSMGFMIEGRLEMRVRRGDSNYEADIAMGWHNPNFEFDQP